MKHKLSIIVPIYNVEEYLEKAIDSLLSQKNFPFEIILVNDGSTDACRNICEKYLDGNDGRIKLVNKTNGGLPSARKAGVEISSGDYITFLDGDDWISPDYYYNMYIEIEKNTPDVVCSGFTLFYGIDKCVEKHNNIEDGFYKGEALGQIRKSIMYMEPYYTFGIFPSLCMKSIKTDLIKKHLFDVPNNITLAEDAACSFPILFECESISIISQNHGYFYRQNQSSMSYKYDYDKTNKIIIAIDYLEKKFTNYYDVYDKEIDLFYTLLIKDCLRNEIKGKNNFFDVKKKLKNLHSKAYVARSLNNITNIPLVYRVLFHLFRKERYFLLMVGFRFFGVLKRGN